MQPWASMPPVQAWTFELDPWKQKSWGSGVHLSLQRSLWLDGKQERGIHRPALRPLTWSTQHGRNEIDSTSELSSDLHTSAVADRCHPPNKVCKWKNPPHNSSIEEGGRHFIDRNLVLFMFWYNCIKYKDKTVHSEMKLKYPKGFRCSIFSCQLIE